MFQKPMINWVFINISQTRDLYKCHGFMKFLPVFMGDYEIKYFIKLIT